MLHDIGSAHLVLASGATPQGLSARTMEAIVTTRTTPAITTVQTNKVVAQPWDCGPIGTKTAVQRPKADCIYTCVQPEDTEALNDQRKALLLAQIAQWAATNPTQYVGLQNAPAVNLLFRSGVLIDVRRSTEQECESGASCPPCEQKECPRSISWWWIIALGVTGVYLGSRIK